MTATAERIAKYELLYGKDEVEQFLDAVLAIQEHIDPAIIRPQIVEEEKQEAPNIRSTPYDDLWHIDEPRQKSESPQKRKHSHQSQKRICLFLLNSIVESLRIGSVIY